MNRIARRTLLLLCLLAGAGAGEAFSLARVQAMSATVKTLRLPFTQINNLAIMEEPLVSQGVIEIDRQRQAVRWEFTGKSVQILRDGKVRRWGADGREETAPGGGNPNAHAFAGPMQGFLSGDWSRLESIFTLAVDPDGAPKLICTAKSPDIARFIASIVIVWRADLSGPERMTMNAAAGDVTEYVFAAPEIDPAIPAERFAGP